MIIPTPFLAPCSLPDTMLYLDRLEDVEGQQDARESELQEEIDK
jgi:hypothetical protein